MTTTLFRKNLNDMTIDESLEELRVIAQLEAKKKTIKGDLLKRKKAIRAKLKGARVAH
jgi:hypothetical protein